MLISLNYLWRRGSPAELSLTQSSWVNMVIDFYWVTGAFTQRQKRLSRRKIKHHTWQRSISWKGVSVLFVDNNPEAHEKSPLHDMVEQEITMAGRRMAHVVGHRSTVQQDWPHEAKSQLEWIISWSSAEAVLWYQDFLWLDEPFLDRALWTFLYPGQSTRRLFLVSSESSAVHVNQTPWLSVWHMPRHHNEPAGTCLYMETYGTAKE